MCCTICCSEGTILRHALQILRPNLRPPLANTSQPRDNEPPATEADVLRKWQEARMEKRLRGEYESAVAHLAEIVRGAVQCAAGHR